MSLSDHLRYLRAMRGGVGTPEIAETLGYESAIAVNAAELRYRPVEDENLVQKLADYYDRPIEEFQWHNERPRKHLTFYMAAALREKTAISLTLRGGQILTGQAEWWDLASIGLRDADGRLLVVQRHAVIDWPQ